MAQFSRLKIWVSGEVLYAADLNNEFNNMLAGFTPPQIDSVSSNLTAMQTVADPYPAATPSLAANLRDELYRLRFQVRAITGEAQWYLPPATTIAAFNTTYANFLNPSYKTDGTDPGRYGVSMDTFDNFLSTPVTAGGTAVTVNADVATVNLTVDNKSVVKLKTVKRKGLVNTTGPGSPPAIVTESQQGAFELSVGFSNVTSTGFSGIGLRARLYKNSTLYDIQNFFFPIDLINLPNPGTLNVLGGGNITLTPANASPNNVTGTGTLTISGATAGSGLYSGFFTFLLPYSAFEFVDFAALGNASGIVTNEYKLNLELYSSISGIIAAGGTYAVSCPCWGAFFVKENL